MPLFDDSGFQQNQLLSPGQPGYSLGSFDDHQALAKFLVSNVALTTNVATLTGKIVEGNIPVAGQLISVRGTAPTSGLFNVTDVAIASVSIDAITGIGTITFALTHADVTSAADGGVALVQVAEQPETIGTTLSAAYNGQAFALAPIVGVPQNGRSITWSYRWTVAPATSCAMALQGAVSLADFTAGTFKALDTGTSTTGETKLLTVPEAINFVRISITAMTSATPAKAIGKIEV